MLNEQRNVVAAVAQGGQLDGDDAQAIIKIFAEEATGNEFAQVFVGGADDADIDSDGGFAADTFEGSLLQDAEKFDLHVGTEFGDLIKEDRSAIS